jgi:hypothetical protein
MIAKNLPAMCAALHPSTGAVILIEAGKMGYIPADHVPIQAYNAERGITPGQQEAMLAGSMFGWDTPSANPANYDQNSGKWKGGA